MVRDEGFEAGAYLFGACGGIRSEGDESGGHEDLGADGLIERFAAGCEGGGDGWVSVDDSLHVWTHSVDGDMHADLTGYVSSAA